MTNDDWNRGYEKGYLDSQEPLTLREIAMIEGMSHQAVAEIIERAFRKIKKRLAEKNIRLEDLL